MTIEDTVVARRPLPGVAAPSSICFSPCKKHVTCLMPANSSDLLTRQLYSTSIPDSWWAPGEGKAESVAKTNVWDPATSSEKQDTEETLSLEDKLRRERCRQMSTGITQYSWGCSRTEGSFIMIPMNGNIFVKNSSTIGNNDIRKVFNKSSVFFGGDDAVGGALDPHLSPDGESVAFVRDSELYILGLGKDAVATRLTYNARGQGKTNGLADFVAQEEMSHYHGYWWSPDSKLIAFEHVDESHIPQFRIMHQGSDSVGMDAQEDHRYPFAGMANPKVKLGVVDTRAARPGMRPDVLWLDLNVVEGVENDDMYLARVDWLPDGSLSAQLQNREQSEVVLVRYDMPTGNRSLILRERSDVWVNLHDLFVAFESRAGEATLSGQDSMETDQKKPNGFFFTWASEASGFQHLYLYYFDSLTQQVKIIRQLTQGDWMVNSIVQIDAERGLVFFIGTKKNPLERQLYACSLWDANKDIIEVTTHEGWNVVSMDPECKLAAVTTSSIADVPFTKIYKVEYTSSSISLHELHTLHEGSKSPLVSSQLTALSKALRPPEIIKFSSRDGAELYGAMYLPDKVKYGPGPYPVIVSVYGGPHAQTVSNQWTLTADMRAQRFADSGYVVLKVDNRGSANRGLLFEGAIKHRMGTVEVDDQVDGVNHLVSKGFADRERVGIYGWSYGGYMAAMCLFKQPDVFHVSVSGAPVTSWDGYDTHYTERYMGTPQSNPAGYKEGSVMTHVQGVQGKLMLVHGLIDENVHFRHTARLINAMISARKEYDLLLFPNERHSPRGLEDRIYMEQRMKAYFDQHLMQRVTKKKKVAK